MAGNLIKFVYQHYGQTIEEEFAEYLSKHYSSASGQIKRYAPKAVNIFTKPPLIKFDIRIKYTFPDDIEFRNLAGTLIFKEAYLHCTCEIDDRIKKFKCDKFIEEGFTGNEYDPGLELTDNLVPVMKKKLAKNDATLVLQNFYGKQDVYSLAPIPIREIINSYGLEINEDYLIGQNCETKGMICFLDKELTLTNYKTNKRETKMFAAGTIFIDAKYKEKYGEYSVNFTLAHELYHWIRHRMQAIVRIRIGEDIYFNSCPRVTYAWWRSEKDIMEKQADNFASALLLHDDRFPFKVIGLIHDRGYVFGKDNSKIVDAALRELSDFYKVSKTAIAIRIVKGGYDYEEFAKYQKDFNSSRKHYEIPINDLLNLIDVNETVKHLLKTGRVIYIKEKLVIRDKKYITDNYKLTDYARKHLDECCISFKVDYQIEAKTLSCVLNKDSYIEKFSFVLYQNRDIVAKANALNDYIKHYTDGMKETKNRCDLFNFFMDKKGYTYSKLEDKSHIKEGVIKKLSNDLDYSPSKETTLRLIVGLNLPPDCSYYYIEIAEVGFNLKASENEIYRRLIEDFYLCDINEWNKVLKNNRIAEI